ncbi:MAG: HAMP domain-containing protein [Herpetosiphonaceae bacterium]|nr:HAMP domain-containing protein [Herpetosiphonaceae bacterium]
MRSLRQRLILSYLLIIALGIGGAAVATWISVEQIYLSTQATNLLAQAEAVAADLAQSNGAMLPAQPYSQLTNSLPGVHLHVIPSQSGVVVNLAQSAALPAKSAVSLNSLDLAAANRQPDLLQTLAASSADQIAPLYARPEIRQAQQGQPATAIRRIPAAANRWVLYAAAPVRAANGAVVSLVYIATPLPASGWAALEPGTRWRLGAILAALIGLAGGAGWWLAAHLARPLSRLASAANAVAAGDLTHTVPNRTGVLELQTLASAFNTMTTSLQQADLAKKTFVADISHELRTPLTIIKGTVETLQDGALDDLAVREGFLTSLASETERLIQLVNDLLILNRANAGALNLRLEPTDLAGLARDRAQRFAGLAAQQGVRITVAADDPDLWVQADAHRLAQVLDNLLHNAIRHAPQGTIHVTLGSDADGVSCSVADSGSGIPATHLPHIFERFYRVDSSRNRGSGGSGLGLAITQALLAAQGGHISVVSVEQQGTTFTFWLPRAAN